MESYTSSNQLLKKVVEGVVGKEVRVACVDSYGDVKVDEFKDILLKDYNEVICCGRVVGKLKRK